MPPRGVGAAPCEAHAPETLSKCLPALTAHHIQPIGDTLPTSTLHYHMEGAWCPTDFSKLSQQAYTNTTASTAC